MVDMVKHLFFTIKSKIFACLVAFLKVSPMTLLLYTLSPLNKALSFCISDKLQLYYYEIVEISQLI